MLQPVAIKKMFIHILDILLNNDVRFGSSIKPIIHIGRITISIVITKTIRAHKAKILPNISLNIFIKKIVFKNYSFQSMGWPPCFIINSFVFEKCLQPKKPLSALKGEGWAAFKT